MVLSIPQDFIARLIQSICRRVQTWQDAQRYHTQHWTGQTKKPTQICSFSVNQTCFQFEVSPFVLKVWTFFPMDFIFLMVFQCILHSNGSVSMLSYSVTVFLSFWASRKICSVEFVCLAVVLSKQFFEVPFFDFVWKDLWRLELPSNWYESFKIWTDSLENSHVSKVASYFCCSVYIYMHFIKANKWEICLLSEHATKVCLRKHRIYAFCQSTPGKYASSQSKIAR